MAFTEDLSQFFDDADFAVDVTYNNGTIQGIFDHEYVATENVEGERPILTCMESSVIGVAHGESLTVNGTDYTVVEARPDGTGIMVLILSE